MMESYGICFKVRELSDHEWEYIAPELLPEWSEAQKSLLPGRIPKGHPMAEAEARYAFLHEGVLRGYLSRSVNRLAMLPFTGNTAVGLTKRLPTAEC
jgi:hypothetical protein